MNTAVKDVMTTRVIWVKKDATFREMAVALREYRVSAFPVVDDDGKVIGVVSEADMLTKEALRRARRDLRHPAPQGPGKARGVTAGDLMTAAVIAVRPDDTVEHAAKLMYDRRVKRLPVTDANGRLVGIISRADVLSVFDRTDEAIRAEILDEVLLGEYSEDPRTLDVTVKDGIVTLTGVPETSKTGHEIVRRVRHIQGVVAVRDRLSYPTPRERPVGRYDVVASFPMD